MCRSTNFLQVHFCEDIGMVQGGTLAINFLPHTKVITHFSPILHIFLLNLFHEYCFYSGTFLPQEKSYYSRKMLENSSDPHYESLRHKKLDMVFDNTFPPPHTMTTHCKIIFRVKSSIVASIDVSRY
jgi:hypothetical protein